VLDAGAEGARAAEDAARGDAALARAPGRLTEAYAEDAHLAEGFLSADDDLGRTLDPGCNSFSGDTPVATPHGERPIADLKVGDTVEAYDPATGKAETEPVQHVWLNHDSDLVDVRLVSAAPRAAAQPSDAGPLSVVRTVGRGVIVGDDAHATVRHAARQAADASGETIHTTASHPWLTADRGWVVSGDLQVGERVVTLGGGTGVVAWVHVVPGQADRYNLTVAKDHTFAVGDGRWVVHNCGGGTPTRLDPNNIGFTQNTIKRVHDDGIHTVEGNIQMLATDPNAELPAVKVFWNTGVNRDVRMSRRFGRNVYSGWGRNLLDDAWYTLDNRRLYEYQMAGRTSIPVEVVTEQQAARQAYKWSTTSLGVEPPTLLP
jgi:hypothetical protein